MPTRTRSHSVRKISASHPRGAARWGYILLLVLVPLALAGYAAYLTLFFYTRYGPVPAIYRPRLYWLSAAIAALVALILFIRIRWRTRTYLLIKPDGIALRMAPQKPLALTWEDIVGVQLRLARTWLPASRRWRGHVVLHLRDDTQIRLDNRFPDLPGIAREIQRRWYAIHLPALRGRWAAGDPLSFGELTISTTGLHWKQVTHPWRTVRAITIQHGRLIVELASRRNLRIPLRHILNPHILLWWLHEEAQR